jgi:peptidoglycan/xylan/chitin deacetylase (PgdA/CDA1 family)
MYHSISETNESGVHPYFRTSTSPLVFAEQMFYLYDNKYETISITDLIKLLEEGSTEDPGKSARDDKKYVVITFDDGFRDFFTEAFPVLERYGFAATVFLSTGFIGNDKRKTFKNKECLTWDEVRELDKKGIVFGSHTITHPVLVDLKKDEVEHEIKYSKEIIEDKLGKTVESFAYPYAFPEDKKPFVNYFRDILRQCGYSHGVSTRIGTAARSDEKYFMKRIPVNSHDDMALFKAKLEGQYDWIYYPQCWLKAVNNKIGRI